MSSRWYVLALIFCVRAAFATALIVATRTEYVVPIFIVLGLVSGLAAGPIMSLPARTLAPPTRALGMGVFLTIFYSIMMIAPWAAGAIAAKSGSARATFDFGATLLLFCCLLLLGFIKLLAAQKSAAAVVAE